MLAKNISFYTTGQSVQTKNTFRTTFLKFKIDTTYVSERERELEREGERERTATIVSNENGWKVERGATWLEEEGRVYSRRCLGGNVM